jgi:pyruvate kinase
MCDAAYSVYLSSLNEENDIQAFVVFTETGRTAQALSRYRPKVPVYAITPDSEIAESLTICYGVTPIPGDQVDLDEKEVDRAGIMKTIHFLLEHKYITFGQKVILLHGDIWGVEGGTSTVKIMRVS